MNLIVTELQKIISPIYLVGGCVRDYLLGREPKDYDFTTPLLPEEIEIAIKNAGRHVYLTGKRFGTVGVKIEGQLVEVTTFRNEHYTPGSRKPQVDFVKDITADLSRRDFTINAIAMRDGHLIDPFNGQEDLKNKIIRCVGDAKTRLKEDPLRILRAARFVSQLEFELDMLLLKALKEKSYKILEVSKERWVMELDKLLMTVRPSRGLSILAYTRLLNYMIPELSLQVGYEQDSPHHSKTLWKHTEGVVDNVPADINLRWAALLHDIGKPFVRTANPKGYSNYIRHDYLGREMVERIALHLKWSNERRKAVKDLVMYHLQENSPLREADNLSK